MSKIQTVIDIANQAAVYVPADESEGMRIDIVEEDEGCFYATGEETGDSYRIMFEDVDLKEDFFYKLELIEVDG